MLSSLTRLRRPFLWLDLALLMMLTLLLSGWTCNAFFSFQSCQNAVAQSEITSLAPATVFGEAGSFLLTVEGNGFTPQSELLWNGNALESTFMDSHHLQTTITQEILDSPGRSFSPSGGSGVLISVRSQGSPANSGCPKQADAAPRVLIIQ